MSSQLERLTELSVVKGFLVPVFSDDVIPGREQRHGLDRESFEMVVSGFACGRCLAYFNTYTAVCPVCDHHRDVHADVVRAHDWEQHLRDRKHAEENPVARERVPRMDERVDAFMRGQR